MKGKVLAGRYEILGKLGSGGMAVVYKAKCTWLDRVVTVKVLRDELVNDEEFVRRFRQEAQAVARLSHTNIVSVYDVGQENGIYYIVMEFVDGPTLKEYIKQKGKISYQEAIDISIQICSALGHAHENNIIHRDIKPHNILITSKGKVKVTDFGIARAASGTTITYTGKILGSVHYLSPEQARGEVVGISSDLYSAGAVLYEMLTGRVPFEGESPVSVALKHVQDPIIPPRELEPSIPQTVEQVVLKALNKDPEKRFKSAQEMIQALKKAMRGGNIDDLMGNEMTTKKEGAKTISKNQKKKIQINDLDRLENKPGRKKKLRPVFWFISIIFIALLLTGLTYMGKQWVYVPEVKVPDVKGKLADEAIIELGKIGLQGEVVGQQFDNVIPKDHVIVQKPLPEEIVKKGRKVELTISRGAQQEKVPDVIGKDITEASIILGNFGFKLGNVEKVYHIETSEGRVISQVPSSGTYQPVGSAINLIVSLGPERGNAIMPNLIGGGLESAREQIKQLGLVLGSVVEEESTQYFVGQIARQEPAAGSQVIPDTVVNLVVSRGPGPSPLMAQVDLIIPSNGMQHEVVIIVEDLKGTREEYRALHNAGEQLIKQVRYYGSATIKVLLDGEVVSEEYFN